MRRSKVFNNVVLMPSACLSFAAALLIIPLKWILAWIIAAAFHELGHLIMLKILRIPVTSVKFIGTGIQIEADITGGITEILTAISGPLYGVILIVFAQWIPRVAMCAIVQSCFNLLPFNGFDGGRFLRCLLLHVVDEKQCERIMHKIQYAVLAILTVLILYAGIVFRVRIMSLYFLCVLIYKSGVIKNSLQRRPTNSTMI